MKLSLLLFLLLFPFFVFPWFSDIDVNAKATLFFLFSLGLFSLQVFKKQKLYLNVFSLVWLVWSLSLLPSAFLSKDWASGLLFVGLAFSSGIFIVVVSELKRSEHDFAQFILGTVLALAGVLCLFGILQFARFAFWGTPSEVAIPFLLPASWGHRISGPFGQANFHALMMVVGSCAFSHFYFFRYATEGKSLRIWAAMIFPFFLFLNFFLTDSRGGKVGFIVVIIASCLVLKRFWPIHERFEFGKKGKALLATFICCWILSIFLHAAVTSPESLAHHQELRDGMSVTSRINMWLASILMFFDKPLFGIGPDNFKGHLYEYQVLARDILKFEYEDMIYTRWAHSEFLQLLAEGGTFSFVFLILLVLIFFFGIRQSFQAQQGPENTFLLLAPIPFLVQSLFSWPLRFPPLLVIFLSLAVIVLPSRGLVLNLDKKNKVLISSLLLGILFVGGWRVYGDFQVGALKRNIHNQSLVQQNFQEFKRLMNNPLVEFALINRGIVPFVRYAVRENKKDMAEDLLPFQKRATYLEGAYWQWYNLARLQLTAGDEEAAKISIRKSLDLNPIHESSWAFLHYLDVLNAARVLGRPVESFYPKGPIDLEIPDVGDTFPKRF